MPPGKIFDFLGLWKGISCILRTLFSYLNTRMGVVIKSLNPTFARYSTVERAARDGVLHEDHLLPECCSSLRHLELWTGHDHLVVVSLLMVCCSSLQVNLCTSHLVHRELLCTHLWKKRPFKSFVYQIPRGQHRPRSGVETDYTTSKAGDVGPTTREKPLCFTAHCFLCGVPWSFRLSPSRTSRLGPPATACSWEPWGAWHRL